MKLGRTYKEGELFLKKLYNLAGAKRVVFSAAAENSFFHKSRCCEAATASAWKIISAMSSSPQQELSAAAERLKFAAAENFCDGSSYLFRYAS